MCLTYSIMLLVINPHRWHPTFETSKSMAYSAAVPPLIHLPVAHDPSRCCVAPARVEKVVVQTGHMLPYTTHDSSLRSVWPGALDVVWCVLIALCVGKVHPHLLPQKITSHCTESPSASLGALTGSGNPSCTLGAHALDRRAARISPTSIDTNSSRSQPVPNSFRTSRGNHSFSSIYPPSVAIKVSRSSARRTAHGLVSGLFSTSPSSFNVLGMSASMHTFGRPNITANHCSFCSGSRAMAWYQRNRRTTSS